ncbi:MAG: hypothetical protein WAM61_11910, partial [Desulfobacterales bacterium]
RIGPGRPGRPPGISAAERGYFRRFLKQNRNFQKICLLLDALGSVKISKLFLLPLLEAGGRVAFFMPMIHWPFRGRANLRNHRKMIICDNQTARCC